MPYHALLTHFNEYISYFYTFERFLLVEDSEIESCQEKLAVRYENAKPIKGVRSYHCFVPSNSGLNAYITSSAAASESPVYFPMELALDTDK